MFEKEKKERKVMEILTIIAILITLNIAKIKLRKYEKQSRFFLVIYFSINLNLNTIKWDLLLN